MRPQKKKKTSKILEIFVLYYCREIEKEEMGASSTLIRRNRSLTPATGDNEEVESAKTSPEKVVNRSIDKEVKEIPINVSKAGTYVFLVLIAIAILLVLNVFFNFPFGLNEDYQDVFGEDVSN